MRNAGILTPRKKASGGVPLKLERNKKINNKGNEFKRVSNIVDINLNISITILNVNALKVWILKRDYQSILKQHSTLCFYKKLN